MVCQKGEGRGGMCEGRREKEGDVTRRAKKRKTQKKDIIKQYRKLIAVLPNICSKTKVSKQIVVEEAIIYIEALQKQLLNNLERQEECENLENNKTDDDEPSSL
eukprot:TRINITY_DN6920_c0_g1_i1.p1 TRINITY_DN6920_c0_g1~~TRINITY_DN6920_c0_g1_i1.p1  ORF type:complete len:104 (-),score=44.79 TRINITY_DN6920_c0_g1_i1:77-388(-)